MLGDSGLGHTAGVGVGFGAKSAGTCDSLQTAALLHIELPVVAMFRQTVTPVEICLVM